MLDCVSLVPLTSKQTEDHRLPNISMVETHSFLPSTKEHQTANEGRSVLRVKGSLRRSERVSHKSDKPLKNVGGGVSEPLDPLS